MATQAGARLKFEDIGVEVVVTKGGDGEITCESGDDPLQIGKRYQSDDGVEVLVTKPGAGTLVCGGAAMTMQEPKKTKSAD